MKIITEYDRLIAISGGLNLTGTILNAFSTGIKTLYEFGQKVGTAIRRIRSKAICKLWSKTLWLIIWKL